MEEEEEEDDDEEEEVEQGRGSLSKNLQSLESADPACEHKK